MLSARVCTTERSRAHAGLGGESAREVMAIGKSGGLRDLLDRSRTKPEQPACVANPAASKIGNRSGSGFRSKPSKERAPRHSCVGRHFLQRRRGICPSFHPCQHSLQLFRACGSELWPQFSKLLHEACGKGIAEAMRRGATFCKQIQRVPEGRFGGLELPCPWPWRRANKRKGKVNPEVTNAPSAPAFEKGIFRKDDQPRGAEGKSFAITPNRSAFI